MKSNCKTILLTQNELTEVFGGKRVLISYVENGVRYLEWVII